MMRPSLDQWLLEAKDDPAAPECGIDRKSVV